MNIHITVTAGRAAGKTYVLSRLREFLRELEKEMPVRKFIITFEERNPVP
jgi:hypothetical protein